jgi:hypothetical protein
MTVIPPSPGGPFHVLYVDDETDEPERKRGRIARSPRLTCELVQPPSLDDELGTFLNKRADLYLIDQDLSERRGYLGTGLVGHIRSTKPDVPIVLLSRSSVLEKRLPGRSARSVERLHVVDYLLLKGDLNEHLERVQATLIGLAEGYAELRNAGHGGSGISLGDLLGASEEEFDELRETSPPVGDERRIPFAVARWIRHTLFEYPGPLLDALHAATLLGITRDAFESPAVQTHFAGARYQGLFDPPEGRWWKRRLLRTATALCHGADRRGAVRQQLRFALGAPDQPLPAPTCVWDGSEGAEAVCYIEERPVKLAHSLRYYPDQRPALMDPARVSYRAIRTSADFDEELLDSSGRALLPEVEALPIPPLPTAPPPATNS